MLNNRGLGTKDKKCEGRKVNIFQMKCLRSLVGVSRMYRVMNEEVHMRADIERELASRAVNGDR